MVDGSAVVTYANIRGRSLRRTVGPVCRLAVGLGLVGWMIPVLVRCWKRCPDLVCEDVFSSYLVPGRCVWMAYDINNIDKKWSQPKNSKAPTEQYWPKIQPVR